MGFAVSATHLVLAVALLSAGGYAASSYWRVSDEMEEARRAEAQRAEEVAHTGLSIDGTPSHDSGAQTLDVNVTNGGATVLEISAFAYLVDGALTTDLASGYPLVAAAAGTDLLLPGETMTVRITNVATAPTHVAVVAGNGVAAYWRS